MKVYAGMDIGGTKVALGVFGEDKTLLGKTKYPSDASLSAEEFFQQAATQLRALLGQLALPEEDLAGIGVGLPCMVRYPAGEVVLCAMLPALNGFGVKACLEGLFPGVQVAVDNDAHCAALAESRHGAGKGRQHMLYCPGEHRPFLGHHHRRQAVPGQQRLCRGERPHHPHPGAGHRLRLRQPGVRAVLRLWGDDSAAHPPVD